jgi:hypothetical protein
VGGRFSERIVLHQIVQNTNENSCLQWLTEIKGGSGKDTIENDANNGIVTVGNHANDVVILGGSNENATLGTGAHDQVQVGVSHLGTTESPGQAINDTITFANGATAELVIGAGAEAGSTAGTENVGQTNVVGAASGMTVDLIIATSFLPIIDATATVSQAKTIETAENLAVASLGGQGGVAYFNFGNDEYIVDAPHAGGSGVGSSDSIVQLVGTQDLVPHARRVRRRAFRRLKDLLLLMISRTPPF